MAWVDWLRANPVVAVAAAAAIVGVWWFLRRPDPVLKEGAKEFDRLMGATVLGSETQRLRPQPAVRSRMPFC